MIIRDIGDELREVVWKNGFLIDTLLPSLIFLLSNQFADLFWAVIASLLYSGIRLVIRQRAGKPVIPVLVGIAGSLLSVLIVWVTRREQNYFLAGYVNNMVTVVLLFGSVVVKRPLVAMTSMLVRRWPLGWFLHPQVYPAYREATLAWALFFIAKIGLQAIIVGAVQTRQAVLLNFFNGWPLTLVLLVLTYVYGVWRLRMLVGPGVDEYRQGVPPPWEGQHKGF